MSIPVGGFPHAKFAHQGGMRVGLRLQCFLKVTDDEGRIATLRLEDPPGVFLLPGELLLVNESPDEAAARVAKTYFDSPLEPKLAGTINFPAMGGEDTSWYLIFVYEAKVDPATLKGTPDTEEIKFVKPGEAPGEWGFAHHEVFEQFT